MRQVALSELLAAPHPTESPKGETGTSIAPRYPRCRRARFRRICAAKRPAILVVRGAKSASLDTPFGRVSDPETPLPHQFPEADSLRILIVDDDDAIRNLFLLALSERYECGTAEDTPEALRLLAAPQFALG